MQRDEPTLYIESAGAGDPVVVLVHAGIADCRMWARECSVMDAERIDRAVLVGASNGGRIVLDTAVTAPGRVSGLVLISAAVPGIPLSDEVQADFGEEGEALATGDIERAKAINLRWWVDGVDRDADTVDPNVRAAVAGWLDELMRDRLADLTVPVLALVGRHDVDGMRTAGRHIADRAPNGALVEIDGAAHLPNLEQPDRVDALLAQFLRSVAQ